MDLGLKIPASCSSTGEEVDLQPGFGTPLTLFTKNGKVIDCISGYVNKSELITKLETVGMIDAE
jgi:thioredoxin-related protein